MPGYMLGVIWCLGHRITNYKCNGYIPAITGKDTGYGLNLQLMGLTNYENPMLLIINIINSLCICM